MVKVTEKTMVTALAVAFIAQVLEKHEDQLTRNEIERARDAAFAACNKMESMGLHSTAYELFLQAVETLEKGG